MARGRGRPIVKEAMYNLVRSAEPNDEGEDDAPEANVGSHHRLLEGDAISKCVGIGDVYFFIKVPFDAHEAPVLCERVPMGVYQQNLQCREQGEIPS